ncbi:MAG: DASS family sodium-coupled anion symporter [Spirochaetia bacterium]|nr:DASS family sodium-coupled anion symporter [Spirochaetia bacterium]
MSLQDHQKIELKQIIYFVAAVVLMLVMKAIPLADSVRYAGSAELTATGQAAMGVLLFALVLWMTEAIPFHITGMLSIVLLTLFKVDTYKVIVKEGFGSDTVTFFIGVLILSAFITTSGLGKRIGVWILSKTGNNTKSIVFGFLLTGTILSMWITNMAVAAMLMPLAVGILEEEKIQPLKSNFGRALLIACAWGSIIGGIGTPSGAGPNALAIGFIKSMAGIDINFAQWMVYGVPAGLLMTPVAWVVLMIFFKPEMTHLEKSKEELRQEFERFPPMRREEIITTILFLITVALWLGSPLLEKWIGINIPISMPVMFTSCLFFLPKVTRIGWSKIESQVSWSGIILIVSGISLGMMLYTTGAARWLSVVLLSGIGGLPSFLMVFVIVFMISMLKIIFSSNTVTATIIIPIMIELAVSLGLPVMSVALPASLVASLAFILVTSSPTNVIPYSAGYFSIADFAKAGLLMTLLGSLILSTVVFTIGSMTGLY